MEQKEREEKRQGVFNFTMLDAQIRAGLFTYPLLVLVCQGRITEEIGECTEEDTEWIEDQLCEFPYLERFVEISDLYKQKIQARRERIKQERKRRRVRKETDECLSD